MPKIPLQKKEITSLGVSGQLEPGPFNWPLSLLVLIVVFLLGSGLISLVPQTYEARAKILVRPMSDFILDPAEASIAGSFRERVNNQLALFEADQTVQTAQSHLEEWIQTKQCPACEHVVPTLSLSILDTRYRIENDYREHFRQSLIVTPEPNSHVVSVAFRSSEDRPDDLSTLLAFSLTAFQEASSTLGRQLIDERMKTVKQLLKLARQQQSESEKALATFQQQHQALDPNTELNALVMQRAYLYNALAATQAEQVRLNVDKTKSDHALMMSVPTVQWLSRLGLDEEIIGIKRQIVMIYAEKAQWMARAGISTIKQLSFSDNPDDEQQQVKTIRQPDPEINVKIKTLDEEIDYLNALLKKRIEIVLKNWQEKTGQKPDRISQKMIAGSDILTVGSVDVQLAIRILELQLSEAGLTAKRDALSASIKHVDGRLKSVPKLQLDFAKLSARSKLAEDKANILAIQLSRLETASPTQTISPLMVLSKPQTPVYSVSPHYGVLYSALGFITVLFAMMAGNISRGHRPISLAQSHKFSSATSGYFDQEDVLDAPTRTAESAFDFTTPSAPSKKASFSPPLLSIPPLSVFGRLMKNAWPFNQPKGKSKSASFNKPSFKSEKNQPENIQSDAALLGPEDHQENFMDSNSPAGHSQPAPKQAMPEFDAPYFQLEPLPSLQGFIEQMEGENPKALLSQSLAEFMTFLMKNRQQSRIHRIGVIPVSAFNTAQSTLLALSLLLAESGQKLALIDADTTAFSLSRWLETFPIPLAKGLLQGKGLYEYAVGQADDFIDVIYPLGKSVYGSFIPAGHHPTVLPENTAPIIDLSHLVRLNGELSTNYDFVFYGLPSLMQSDEALQLGGMMDGLVLVSHVGITRQEEETWAKNALAHSGLPLLAILRQP